MKLQLLMLLCLTFSCGPDKEKDNDQQKQSRTSQKNVKEAYQRSIKLINSFEGRKINDSQANYDRSLRSQFEAWKSCYTTETFKPCEDSFKLNYLETMAQISDDLLKINDGERLELLNSLPQQDLTISYDISRTHLSHLSCHSDSIRQENFYLIPTKIANCQSFWSLEVDRIKVAIKSLDLDPFDIL